MKKLALIAVALMAWVPAAHGDTIVSADPSASNVSAYGGILAWSQRNPAGGYLLFARVAGVASQLPVPPSRIEFDPDLGAGRGGGVVAVYQRCGGPCGTYEYSFTSGQERRLPSIEAQGCRVVGLSAWRGTLAFVRRGYHCRRPGLFVRRPGHRVRRLRRVTPQYGFQTDTDGRVVVFANPAESRVRSIPLKGGRGHKLFHDGAESGDVDVFLQSPTIDGRYAYWLDVEEGVDGNTADLYRALRRSGRGCRLDERDYASVTPAPPIPIPADDLPLSPDSLAVDGGTVYYSRYGLFQIDPAPSFAKHSGCTIAAFGK
jgi:hypothetical protein